MVSVVYLLLALVLSLAIIPQAMRFAPALGMIDKPNERKVHVNPIARVGGVGIVIGAIVALLFAENMDALTGSYVIGSIVLFVFGLADDRFELGHYAKFIGQFVAVGLVVFYGDLVVYRLPFFDDSLPYSIAAPFTVIAMVGVVNAFNHADGLDGLAGGEALLSLLAAALIAFWSNDSLALHVAMVAIGGLIGFLRFNNHPARVFMGDAGSQYLGFTVAFLAIELTQQGNPALSAAMPALLIGLPVVDILTVFYLRASSGLHWFKASRNHFHHRLLDIGFVHAESVVLIYLVQFVLTVAAVTLRYYPDAVVVSVYAAVILTVFAALIASERSGWRAHGHNTLAGRVWWSVLTSDRLREVPAAALLVLVPAYFVVLPLATGTGNSLEWIAISEVIFGVLLLAWFGALKWLPGSLIRIPVYVGVTLVVYDDFVRSAHTPLFETVFFAVVALMLVGAVRTSTLDVFRTNPLDYLVGMLLLGLLLLHDQFAITAAVTALIIKSVILLYAVEFLINRGLERTRLLYLAIAFALLYCGLGTLWFASA